MQTITHTHGPAYRSINFHSRAQAEQFAGFIAKNPLFRAPEVVKNERTKREAYYVAYGPATDHACEALRAKEQAKRTARAQEEGAAYRWCYDGCATFVRSLSGEVYNVRETGCGCPDSQRIDPSGIACKHREARRLGLGTWVSVAEFFGVPGAPEPDQPASFDAPFDSHDDLPADPLATLQPGWDWQPPQSDELAEEEEFEAWRAELAGGD